VKKFLEELSELLEKHGATVDVDAGASDDTDLFCGIVIRTGGDVLEMDHWSGLSPTEISSHIRRRLP